MPTNLYGPHDNFDLETSHVLPALLRKFHEARLFGHSHVEIWGTGKVRREFLHVDDLAEACCFLMEQSSESVRLIASDGLINIGAGKDIEIRELASLIRDVVGVDCELSFDTSKPDGTLNKLLDLSRIKALGWTARISLRDGLKQTYEWYCAASDRNNSEGIRGRAQVN
jgi:GDP-L-fucose synthase